MRSLACSMPDPMCSITTWKRSDVRYRRVRPQADYRQSLTCARIRQALQSRCSYEIRPDGRASANSRKMYMNCCGTFASSGTDIATIGQYLQPTRRNLEVSTICHSGTVRRLPGVRASIGFRMVFSGPFVRSSYMADFVREQASAAEEA